MTSPVWHPFTQHGLEEPIPLVERAEGAALYTADGRRVIDAISSWWVTTHGHGHPRIVAAIADQAARLDQLIFAGWTHEPAERLARDLIALLPPPLAQRRLHRRRGCDCGCGCRSLHGPVRLQPVCRRAGGCVGCGNGALLKFLCASVSSQTGRFQGRFFLPCSH